MVVEEWFNIIKFEWFCDRFDYVFNCNNYLIIFDNKKDFLLIFSIDYLVLFFL